MSVISQSLCKVWQMFNDDNLRQLNTEISLNMQIWRDTHHHRHMLRATDILVLFITKWTNWCKRRYLRMGRLPANSTVYVQFRRLALKSPH